MISNSTKRPTNAPPITADMTKRMKRVLYSIEGSCNAGEGERSFFRKSETDQVKG